MKTLISIILILNFVSCSTSSKKAYTSSKDYQMREEMNESFYKKDDQPFTEEQISSLLSKKVNLKRDLKLAVVKLGHDGVHSSHFNHLSNKSFDQVITKENAKAFRNITKGANYLKDVSLIPSFMMPAKRNMQAYRDVAALLQADLVLVITSKSFTDYKYHIVSKNEAKAHVTMEGIVIDVKTGVIPFTTIASSEILLKKDKNRDFTNKEFRQRATIKAEDKAIVQIAKDIKAYFN